MWNDRQNKPMISPEDQETVDKTVKEVIKAIEMEFTPFSIDDPATSDALKQFYQRISDYCQHCVIAVDYTRCMNSVTSNGYKTVGVK